MEKFYFSRHEDRVPYQPVKPSPVISFLSQLFGAATVISGIIYFCWRWTSSLNSHAPIFSVLVASAETVSFISMCLYVFDLWKIRDNKREAPPHYLSDIEPLNGKPDRPLAIDFFIATLNEEIELVRYTIKDAKAVNLPYPDLEINIYVLDDGRRDGRNPAAENLKKLCEEEGVHYITREDNRGFKAGNLKNGLENSSGDIFVILDADTRPFPDFLVNMTGYFRKHKVAWVQSCHWFYETSEAISFSSFLIKAGKVRSPQVQRLLNFFFGRIRTGEDIYGSDPRHFYEVIQRKRHRWNASFCCGASSVHRRSAVMKVAEDNFRNSIEKDVKEFLLRNNLSGSEVEEKVRALITKETELTPFVYHASEDLYTSMVVLSHPDRYEGVLHPYVESKFLSPQDIDTYVKQRGRYAKGSIDIAINDNPLFKKGLSFAQRLCYFNAVTSYFSCIWIMIFLLSPIIYLFFHIIPVDCPAEDFLKAFLPFFLVFKVSEVFASWGVSQKRGKQYYICLFWINFLSIISVVRRQKIKFRVTSKSKQKLETNPFFYAWPHITIVGLTLLGLLFNLGYIIFTPAQLSLGFTLNAIWGLHNCHTLMVFVRAAYWNSLFSEEETETKAAVHVNTVIT
jgi:cellulose synthase (UDP-forming)